MQGLDFSVFGEFPSGIQGNGIFLGLLLKILAGKPRKHFLSKGTISLVQVQLIKSLESTHL